MTHSEWLQRYSRLRAIADRVAEMRRERAVKLCHEAGLDSGLLGIHPHNAMCGFESGHPWPEVNYSKCRACIRVLATQFEASEIVRRWDRRVRGF